MFLLNWSCAVSHVKKYKMLSNDSFQTFFSKFQEKKCVKGKFFSCL